MSFSRLKLFGLFGYGFNLTAFCLSFGFKPPRSLLTLALIKLFSLNSGLLNGCASSSMFTTLLDEIEIEEDVETDAEVEEQEDNDDGEIDCELT